MTHRLGRSMPRLLCSFLCSLVPALALAQAPATVRGSVRDSATGKPLVKALVAAIHTGRFGREPTDSLGRFVLDRIPSGDIDLEFNCPSRTALGRSIGVRRVRLAPGL